APKWRHHTEVHSHVEKTFWLADASSCQRARTPRASPIDSTTSECAPAPAVHMGLILVSAVEGSPAPKPLVRLAFPRACGAAARAQSSVAAGRRQGPCVQSTP